MKIKFSATFEGKCDICGKEKPKVFSAGNEETKKVVTVCKECADKFGEKATEKVVEEYGKRDEKAFEGGMKVYRKAEAG